VNAQIAEIFVVARKCNSTRIRIVYVVRIASEWSDIAMTVCADWKSSLLERIM
jgi:hypothetical protein